MVWFHDRILVLVRTLASNYIQPQEHQADSQSRYAFPPLLNDIVSKDVHLTKHEIANSNIIALAATLLVRLVAGTACDRFGPRVTFAAVLLIGAIPTFLAGTVNSAAELYACRFFIGILGGAFVPCQVWTTGFFDKNIVGTANSLTAGFGNAGGGITYFVMPAIYTSLVGEGVSKHSAWRISFIVPGILITFVALCLFFLCEDTPTGKWADRFQTAENNLRQHGVEGDIVEVPGEISAHVEKDRSSSPSTGDIASEEKKLGETRGVFNDNEAQLGEQQMLDTARGEVVQKPSLEEAMKVIFSIQTLAIAACYFCTFGVELSVNSVLGTYYMGNLKLSLQESGDYAAMFGLLNVVCRPLGGIVSDLMYRKAGGVWGKKIVLHLYCTMAGVFMVVIGVTNPKNLTTLVGLVGGGLAFFVEGANGINYSLVPHVHPYANGIVSGVVGAAGNLGGICFAICFRYSLIGEGKLQKTNYGQAFYTIGAIVIGLNLLFCWVRPVPKSQIGGR